MVDEIGVFTPEQARMLWQDYLSRQQLNPQSSRNFREKREIYAGALCQTVVLDAAIAAPVNGLTAATTGNASLLFRNAVDNLIDSEITIEVVNRMEGVSLAQYTLCVVTRVDGEWRITSADCDPLGDWP